MKRLGLLILIVAAGCSPHYTSGKTQCSSAKQCPSGYSCSDDGTNLTHYCFENKTLGCPSAAGFYCSQSKTCWPKPGACSTVTLCATTKNPGNVICTSANYHPDCNGTACLPNGAVADAGPGLGGMLGTGGATGKGGGGGTTLIGYGGVIGTGGLPDSGLGGNKDVGAPDSPPDIIVISTGGTKDAALDGVAGAIGTGGIRDAAADGLGGAIGTGGVRDAAADGTGGVRDAVADGTGGIRGTGGIIGTGGSTGTSLCSGTMLYVCADNTDLSTCSTMNGCTWDPSNGICTGTPSPCSSYTTSTWCVYNGCTWAGAYTCNATPMTSYCSGLTIPTTDAGTPDLCTACDYSSCCGQLTNCKNDPTGSCSNNYSGPLWNAWVDCLVNCCGSSTYCGYY